MLVRIPVAVFLLNKVCQQWTDDRDGLLVCLFQAWPNRMWDTVHTADLIRCIIVSILLSYLILSAPARAWQNLSHQSKVSDKQFFPQPVKYLKKNLLQYKRAHCNLGNDLITMPQTSNNDTWIQCQYYLNVCELTNSEKLSNPTQKLQTPAMGQRAVKSRVCGCQTAPH